MALDLGRRTQVQLLESFHGNHDTAISRITPETLKTVVGRIVTVCVCRQGVLINIDSGCLIVLRSWLICNHGDRPVKGRCARIVECKMQVVV